MNLLLALKVRTRLALGFGLLLGLLGVLATLAIVSLQSLNPRIGLIVDDRYAKVDLAQDIAHSVSTQARYMRDALIAGPSDPGMATRWLDKTDALVTENNGFMAALDKQIVTPHGRELFNTLAERRKAYGQTRLALEGLIREGRYDEAGALVTGELRLKQDAFFEAVEAMVHQEEKLMRETAGQAEADGRQATQFMLAVSAAAVVLAVVLAVMIGRSLLLQLGGEPTDLARIADAIAQGNLGVAVPVREGDRHSVMAAMHTMRTDLADVVGQVRHGSEQIAAGTQQIAVGTADLSHRTEEQASNLQQAAASMEQLHTAVAHNAESADQANQLATDAAQAAAHGGTVVGNVVSTMEDIATSSRRIADIIGVIDGIAFQTNLLALNAAVESARAGELGRGFAVVAGEVRTLAQRAAHAATEIKGLIGDSVAKVEAGSRQADAAGQAMQDIVQQVERVSQLIADITRANGEQVGGIGQVSTAVQQIDEMTQQNAALVEQSSAAADSLRSQAERLNEAVSRFQLA